MTNEKTESLYGYNKSSFEENKDFFENFLLKLKKPFDDYLEMNINNSIFYSINYRDNHIGFFTILEDKYITSFYIPDSLLYLAKDFFNLILKNFQIEMMLVTSFDEISLCLSMDYLSDIKTHYLYYTLSGLPVRNAEYPVELFKKATLEDISVIKKHTGNFIDFHESRIEKDQLYILRDNEGSFLGLGIIILHALQPGICSFGVFVREGEQRNFAGRSILIHLLNISKDRLLSPRCACPIDNDAYRRTLESAGFVNDSRLFVINIAYK